MLPTQQRPRGARDKLPLLRVVGIAFFKQQGCQVVPPNSPSGSWISKRRCWGHTLDYCGKLIAHEACGLGRGIAERHLFTQYPILRLQLLDASLQSLRVLNPRVQVGLNSLRSCVTSAKTRLKTRLIIQRAHQSSPIRATSLHDTHGVLEKEDLRAQYHLCHCDFKLPHARGQQSHSDANPLLLSSR